MNQKHLKAEVLIIGGGLAGLSAAIYLGRAKRDTLLVDFGKSMARWEPHVQNYLGFSHGIEGGELLQRGRSQARRYGIRFARDRIESGSVRAGQFSLSGRHGRYGCRRVLIATGIFHIPPDIPGVTPCLGHSMFFCKDCDGFRLQGKNIAIYGWSEETAEYALGLLVYSPCVFIVTDGREPKWSRQWARWLHEYRVPIYAQAITDVQRRGGQLRALEFVDGLELAADALFTTRGDVYLNHLAKGLGARVNDCGEILVDEHMRTNVRGLYAAGCVTPANCQMIIAAGQGATAAQAINRDLFEETLVTHSLRHFRRHQLRTRRTQPNHIRRILQNPAGKVLD